MEEPKSSPGAQTTAGGEEVHHPAPSATSVPLPSFSASPTTTRAVGGDLEARIAAIVTQQFQRQEAAAAAREHQLHQSIQKSIASVVKKDLIPAMNKQVTQAVQQSMGQLQKHMDKTVKESTEKAISKHLQASLGEPMKAGFREAFAEQLIPSFEKSVGRMFEQINGSFEAAMTHKVEKPFNGKFDEMRRTLLLDVRSATQNLNEGTANLQQACASLNQAVADFQAKASAVASATPAPCPVVPGEEMKRLVEAGEVAVAFRFTLTTQDVELLTELCKMVDSSVLNEKKLAQPLICSLVQQLGFDLESDQAIKMTWLQAALLVLDSKDPVTSKMLPTLLGDLAQSLSESFKMHSDPTDPAHNSFKLMMHLVNSMNK